MLAFDCASVRSDEAMSHGSCGRNAVQYSCQNIGSACTSGDYGSFCAIDCCPWSVSSSGTEFAYRLVRGAAYSGCFRSHCHLMVHNAKHRSLKDLRLDKRSFHCDNRLIRECYFTFPHGIYIASELHACQIMSELGVSVTRKELLEELLRHRTEVFHHFDYLIGTAYHGPVIILRSLSVKQIENCDFFTFTAVHKRLSHSILVLVGAICKFFKFHGYLYYRMLVISTGYSQMYDL